MRALASVLILMTLSLGPTASAQVSPSAVAGGERGGAVYREAVGETLRNFGAESIFLFMFRRLILRVLAQSKVCPYIPAPV
jgi:hypothetical protein